jgi:hypothetical protein
MNRRIAPLLAALGVCVSVTGVGCQWSDWSDPGALVVCDGGAVSNVTVAQGSPLVTSPPTASPATIAVPITVSVSFSCPVQGVSHAALSASVGQLSSASSQGGSSGGGSSGGGSGEGGAPSSAGPSAAGSSVTILLTNIGADAGNAGNSFSSTAATASTLVGYATLQISAGRQTQVQAVVGDTATCVSLNVTASSDAGASPDGSASATSVAAVDAGTCM